MHNHSTFSVGDTVCVHGHTTPGTITRISKRSATVTFPTLTLQIAIDKLTQAPATPQPTPTRRGARLLNQDPQAAFHFDDAIDLHGMRVHEALAAVDRWIDQACLLERKHLKIIHGKGDGILRHAVRTHLQGQPFIQRIIDKHPLPGGAGVTWIALA